MKSAKRHVGLDVHKDTTRKINTRTTSPRKDLILILVFQYGIRDGQGKQFIFSLN